MHSDSTLGERLVVETTVENVQAEGSSPVWSVSHYLKLEDTDSPEWGQARSFFQMVFCLLTIQLTFTSVLSATLSFAIPASSREHMHHDTCTDKLHMSCLDVAVNAVLVFILLPLVFRVGIIPGWNKLLFVVWTIVVGLDISLLVSSFDFREKAVFCLCLTTLTSAAIWALLSSRIRYITWISVSAFGTTVCIVVGSLFQLWFGDKKFWWPILIALGLVNIILVELRLVSNHVSPKEHFLAVLFLLFPEGLACLAGRGEQRNVDVSYETETEIDQSSLLQNASDPLTSA